MSKTDERAKQAFPELEQTINDLYSKPLSSKLYRRARREYRKVKRLQKLLHRRPDIIACRIDKGEGFYFGNRAIMEYKTEEYMSKTEAYQEMITGRCPLADILRSTEAVLDYLVKKKTITNAQRDKLLPKMNKLELAYLYTLPKVHKAGTPIRPIVSGLHAPVTFVSKFLYHLLTPIYMQVAHETTFINSINLVRRLETYAADGYLKPTTKFITADVENLYTMIPREGGIDALIRFLNKYSKYRKIGPFTIDMILKMARLILNTNYFAYKNKYYQQKRGGAMGSAFTQVYANIYMLEWEKDLIEHQTSKHEIYGRFVKSVRHIPYLCISHFRYIDDIFMTMNEPFDELTKILDDVQQKDVNIKIKPTIHETVHFLDVTIKNENGELKTSIYHKPTTDPYFLPYTSDHPHRIHRNIPYTALVRAARLCSNLHDFHLERLRIDVSLLLNNYPPKIITNQFLRFFQVNKADVLIKRFDEQTYKQLHRKLLYQPSKREIELKAIKKDPVLFPPILQQKPWNPNVMYLRYPFESGPMSTFPPKFLTWWKKHYQYPGSPANRIQTRLIPKTNRSLQNFLIRKKPSRLILTRMEPKTQ
ncbi:unnamed protein product [Rotaria sp. Silwood1]|nr:unnamed protein product [Rotaria sp. Silwood1]CAF4880291.1 unnamed protein product [Rotaria sp. Silwood1]CAF4935564.1 unnamed protein product [Rotaria sp. Silwood1]